MDIDWRIIGNWLNPHFHIRQYKFNVVGQSFICYDFFVIVNGQIVSYRYYSYIL